MTQATQTPPVQEQENNQQKEHNFAQLRKGFEHERNERLRLEQEVTELKKSMSAPKHEEEDNDDEPYVDRRKLNKFGKQLVEQSKQDASELVKAEVQRAIQETERKMWFKANPDFEKVMTPEILNKLEQQHKDLSDSILTIPDQFERQRMAYANIKALRLDQPAPKEESIQDKINRNATNPGYQPSGPGNAPYVQAGDFSPAGQKDAYERMKQAQRKLSL